MNKITTLLIAVCIILAGCARRTDTATFSAKVTLELDIPEMITSQSIVGGAGTTIPSVSYSAAEGHSGSQDATSRNDASSDAVSSESALSRAGASTEESITSRGDERDLISEVSFYIFDDAGDFVSKSTFACADSYSLDLPKNGRYTIYAMCNMSGMADMPEACSQSDLEAMTVSHRESYDMLPFAGKTQAVLSADNAQSVRIPLNRLNSAIRIENRDVYRMELTKATVSGLPSCANIFDTGTEAPGVTYDRTARATVDADGNAIVYSFLVPEERMANVRIEAEATLKNASADKTSAIASLSFMERLEAGRQSEALVGYIAGGLKIGSPDNWGNIGYYELPGGVRLQVTGGEFFDYKNTKALRASSGGGVFAFTVTATEGAAAFNITDAADWVTVSDKTVTVAPNTSSVQRECRIAVTVGGKNVGVFYIVQGKCITFSCATLAIADGRIEMVGGTGDASVVHTVAFDISDDELDGMDILADDNGVKGIIIETDRAARNIAIRFMPTVDASEVAPDGVSLPVRFVDVNGNANAILTVAQRPVKITFDPARHNNVSYSGGTVTAAVTAEDGRRWSFESATDKNGDPVEWIACTSPDGEAESGENMVLEVAPNTVTSGRTAEVRVRAGHTLSKPYEIVQVPSYGVRDITVSNGIWDAATSTLKVYSCYGDYGITFWTEMAIPEYLELKAVYKGSWIELGEIERLPDNEYRFNIYCEDSYSTEEEETTAVSITVDGNVIGGFTLIKALWPSFIPEERDIWGGVKDRPELKRVSFRVSDWDIYDFSTGDDRLTVKQISDDEIEIGYAETLRYDDEVIDTYVDITTRNLNNYTGVNFHTTQFPVSFDISEADLQKLSDVSKDATDVDITVNTKADAESVPWRVASTSADWLTTDPAAGGTETNASGAPLTVKFAANSGGQRTGNFVLESLNTTSQAFTVSQKRSVQVPVVVTIGGVTWSSFNVDTPGVLATDIPSNLSGTREDSHGKFYQWDKKVAWATTTSSVSGWDIVASTSDSWQPDNNPCPSGFEVPTKDQWTDLINACTKTYSGGWSLSDYGYLVLANGSNELEFSAIGYRSNNNSGSLVNAGTCGYYSTSEQYNSNYTYCVYLSRNLQVGTSSKVYGRSVRCVQSEIETVSIGGAEWTLYNVDEPSILASSLPSELSGTRTASHGKFYQFNRKIAWASTGPISDWNYSVSSTDSWQSSNNPCPNGFEVPTKEQWDALVSACNAISISDAWSSSNYGYLTLIDKTNSNNKLEFPAVGSRSNTSGSLNNNGGYGYYWSSTIYNYANSYSIYFDMRGRINTTYGSNTYGRSVRCVRQ